MQKNFLNELLLCALWSKYDIFCIFCVYFALTFSYILLLLGQTILEKFQKLGRPKMEAVKEF